MARRPPKHRYEQSESLFPSYSDCWETKGIFSDHYIRTRLRESQLWPKDEEVNSIWQFCENLWTRLGNRLAKANEATTRQEFIDKVLNQLNFHYLPNQPIPGKRKQEPDYILFADIESKNAVIGKSLTEQYETAIALLEAKKVNHPLDTVSRNETPGRFPHQQIRDYLQAATNPSGHPYFRWGILTNGNLWRLYCRDTPPEAYFELNFEKAIRTADDFAIFVALFQPKAFLQDSEGLCPLDYLRAEALHYQTSLEDNLRERVFNILLDLANGFYNMPENHITENDGAELYENCLIFLYRLLFILYAEGRGVLPAKPTPHAGSNKNYRERYSLQRLIPKLQGTKYYTSDDFTELYEELLGLFHLINGDQPARNRACNVPLYNGGLFDPQKYPKLEQWRLGEKTLADVLRGLMFARIPARSGQQVRLDFGETIDYADLNIRQLGSIYEGLLEKRFIWSGGKIIYAEDKRRRKETGSYYTPDCVVRYIVENALQPLCDRIEANLHNKSDKDDSFAKEVLKLKILDPAMGSGHFLVRATEFLADKILNHETTALKIDKVPPGVSQAQAEMAYWRRQVVEHCIYGVDLNPLAVELAKLSLWLTCIAVDQPLNFLDHHLVCGDSLVGAEISELAGLPDTNKNQHPQLQFGPDLAVALADALKAIKEIEATESLTLQSVKEKESIWQRRVREKLLPFKTVADIWTSTYFGLVLDDNKYQHLAKLIVPSPDIRSKAGKELQQLLRPLKPYIATARESRHFFHWELEFPEAFFNPDGSRKENPGFDAVIGNPPYDIFIEDRYFSRSLAAGTGNLFGHFIARAIQLTKKGGSFGFIVPLSFSCGSDYERLRREVFRRFGRLIASHFSIRPGKVFPGVDQRVTIFVASGAPDDGCLVSSSRLYRFHQKDRDNTVMNPELGEVGKMTSGFIPRVANPIGAGIYTKFRAIPTTIGSYYVDPDKAPENARWWYHSIGRYWIKAYNFKPVFKRDGRECASSDTINMASSSPSAAIASVCLINSNLFYFWWILQSDEFHILKSQVLSMPMPESVLHDNHLQRAVKRLMADYKAKAITKRIKAGGRLIEMQEIHARLSVPLINEIDRLLAPHYNLTEDELQFLMTYDKEFRLTGD
ncbi:MAG: N-6 DNA methylase [candidate division WOR-3 bacterium]